MRILKFKPRPGKLAYAWYSAMMEQVVGGMLFYRTPAGQVVRVTLVDEWRGASRMAKWPDLKYVGRVRLGWCRKVTDRCSPIDFLGLRNVLSKRDFPV